MSAEVLDKFALFATIAVSRAADRAKKLEAELERGFLRGGRSNE